MTKTSIFTQDYNAENQYQLKKLKKIPSGMAVFCFFATNVYVRYEIKSELKIEIT